MTKSIEELEKEIEDLRSRLRGIERVLSRFPTVDHYIDMYDDLHKPTEDELYEDAKRLVKRLDYVDASSIQVILGCGYGQSSRLLAQLEKDGIVEPEIGSKGNKVIKNTREKE